MGPKSPTIRNFVNNFIKKELDLHLHQFPETAKAIQEKIVASEKERKELSGIRKLAREKAKKVNLHNKKLRDCRAHFNTKHKQANDSTLFIVEGDSAGGSITKTRDVNTQAVFSLKGKPLNAFGLSKKIVYQNDEFNCLQSALDIEDGLDTLRYNKVVIATDADVDGMHIRLLLLTFFLQFFPDLVRQGHLYILQTPLFRVRTKKKTEYCYTEAQKNRAVEKLGKGVEITRFKGLGEASPEEFATFIGPKIKLDPVTMSQLHNIDELLSFYMGKNTPERQGFIIENLQVEKDLIEVAS
jgi:topoisomerase-4 subunit B